PNVVALLKGFRHRLGVPGKLKLKELAMRFCFAFGVVLPILGEASPEVASWPGILGLGGKTAGQFTAIRDHVGHRRPPPLLRGQLVRDPASCGVVYGLVVRCLPRLLGTRALEAEYA